MSKKVPDAPINLEANAPRIFSINDIANIYGVTVPVVRNWGVTPVRLGRNGKPSLYDIADIITYHKKEITGGINEREEQARLTKSKADLSEIEYKIKTGELVNSADVQSTLDEYSVTVRSSVQSIAAKLAPELLGIDDPKKVFIKLRDAINEALDDASEIISREISRPTKRKYKKK